MKLDPCAPDIHTRLRNEAIVRRALDVLEPRDREIFVRLHLRGQPDIDVRSEMQLSRRDFRRVKAQAEGKFTAVTAARIRPAKATREE